MKKNQRKLKGFTIDQGFMILSFLFAAVIISSCSRKVIFPVSTVVPGAEAELTVGEDANNNYRLELEVRNLADPERLRPARKYYSVWLITREHGTINLGNLELNRKGEGKLESSTPYVPKRMIITAEDERKPVIPSTQKVLESGELKI